MRIATMMIAALLLAACAKPVERTRETSADEFCALLREQYYIEWNAALKGQVIWKAEAHDCWQWRTDK